MIARAARNQLGTSSVSNLPGPTPYTTMTTRVTRIFQARRTRAFAMTGLTSRGVFRGIVDLQAAINRYLAEINDNPQPFTWTADPDAIIERVRRAKQALKSIH